MDYVTARVLPPQPDLPKPRFSLYLSSQLQYGVVVVYHRQCSFLLGEGNSLRGTSRVTMCDLTQRHYDFSGNKLQFSTEETKVHSFKAEDEILTFPLQPLIGLVQIISWLNRTGNRNNDDQVLQSFNYIGQVGSN